MTRRYSLFAASLLAIVVAGLLCLPAMSHAADYYWDTNSATAGAGATPNGTWASGGTTWSSSSAGTIATSAYTTLLTDDLYFVAGPSLTSGFSAYTVTVSGDQNAKSLNFQAAGNATISGGTSIALDSGGISIPQFNSGIANGSVTISTAVVLNASQNWANNSAKTLTVGAVTIGANTLTLNGTGSAVTAITGSTSLAGGSIVNSGSAPTRISGTVAVSSTSTLDAYGSGKNIIVTGNITGPGGATISSSNSTGGIVSFQTGTNSYLGDTTINSGATLALSAAATPTSNFVLNGGRLFARSLNADPGSGGTQSETNTNWTRAFTTTGASSFVVSSGTITGASVLVVAGGGGGAGNIGGGGGGGGVLSITGASLTGTTNLSVGGGGAGGTGGDRGTNGTQSTFGSATAAGGGGGGAFEYLGTSTGLNGGSGGGAGADQVGGSLPAAGGNATGSSLGSFTGTIYGNVGGSVTTARVSATSARGGGGAGAAATSGPADDFPAGAGGVGKQVDIGSFTGYYWAGGGGGGAYTVGGSPATGGAGGLGGGGGGAASEGAGLKVGGAGGGTALSIGAAGVGSVNAGSGGAGGANTGGGGGGGAWNGGSGGAGGSGIVIVSYAKTYSAEAITLGSGQSITVNSTSTLDAYGIGGSITIQGAMTGSGGINIDSSVNAGGIVVYGTTAKAYSGTTTINSGATLLVNSSTSSSTNTFAVNGTLGGGGSIAGAVTINSGGTHSPGASPGTQTVASEIWNGGGKYTFELNIVDTSAVAQTIYKGTDPGHDWINITNGLTINATMGNEFIIDITGLNGSSVGAVTNWDNTKNYDWVIATAGTGVGGFSANAFTLSTSNFATFNNLGGGTFSIATVGNDVVLSFAAAPVPEPHHVLLICVGAMLVGLTIRRRLRAAAI